MDKQLDIELWNPDPLIHRSKILMFFSDGGMRAGGGTHSWMVRVVLDDGSIKSDILTAGAKLLAPDPTVTVPRLEAMGAMGALRAIREIRDTPSPADFAEEYLLRAGNDLYGLRRRAWQVFAPACPISPQMIATASKTKSRERRQKACQRSPRWLSKGRQEAPRKPS